MYTNAGKIMFLEEWECEDQGWEADVIQEWEGTLVGVSLAKRLLHGLIIRPQWDHQSVCVCMGVGVYEPGRESDSYGLSI